MYLKSVQKLLSIKGDPRKKNEFLPQKWHLEPKIHESGTFGGFGKREQTHKILWKSNYIVDLHVPIQRFVWFRDLLNSEKSQKSLRTKNLCLVLKKIYSLKQKIHLDFLSLTALFK